MNLSFFPKPGHLVHWPGVKMAGTFPAYVGRENVTIEQDGKAVGFAHKAAAEPVVVDSDSKAGRRFRKLAYRDGSLYPADKATADACQIPFVEVELVDGEYQPKGSVKAPKAQKGGN